MPPDLGKSVEDAVNAAFSESSSATPAGDAAPPQPSSGGTPPSAGDAPASGGERARDGSGKFKKAEEAKPAGKDTKEPSPAETATGGQQQASPKPQQANVQPAIAPPTSWKGGGKIEWSRLPQHIQKELADDYAQRENTSSELTELRSAIGERSQALAAQYGSVGNALKSILAGSDMANQNPKGFILWLAQRNGIDLTQLTGQAPGQSQQLAQDANPLAQEVVQLRNQLQQFFQQQSQSQTQTLKSQIQAFANDQAHPYFNDVRNHMSRLMAPPTDARGNVIGEPAAKTMQEAYDMAVWAHPQVRPSLIEAERKKDAEEAAAKVEAARKAAGSLTGSPAGATVPNSGSKPRSLRETVAEAAEAAGFR